MEQLLWLHSIMLSATAIRLALWFYCRSSGDSTVQEYTKGKWILGAGGDLLSEQDDSHWLANFVFADAADDQYLPEV